MGQNSTPPNLSILLTRSKKRGQAQRDFFDSKGSKLKNLVFLGEIFQTQNQTKVGWPQPEQKKLTRPRSKISDPDPSLSEIQVWFIFEKLLDCFCNFQFDFFWSWSFGKYQNRATRGKLVFFQKMINAWFAWY